MMFSACAQTHVYQMRTCTGLEGKVGKEDASGFDQKHFHWIVFETLFVWDCDYKS